MRTTQTGIPIEHCGPCGYEHADQMTDMPSKYYPAVWLRNRAERLEGDDEKH
jgi:hypothetical protein